MIFTPNWKQPKLTPIADDGTLAARRAGLSKTQQKKQGIHPSQIDYAKKNNAIREAGKLFLTLFDETSVRNCIQKANASFKHDPEVNALLALAIGTQGTVTIDQGTHQDEDVDTGGFKLHFDVRRPSDNLCFHFYIGQNLDGTLKIIEISYMNNGKIDVHPQ
jgi:hypothetical protein